MVVVFVAMKLVSENDKLLLRTFSLFLLRFQQLEGNISPEMSVIAGEADLMKDLINSRKTTGKHVSSCCSDSPHCPCATLTAGLKIHIL